MRTATPHRTIAALRRLVLVLALGWASAAGAATITVTTADDERNNDGDCSLREAVAAANTDTAVDACTAGEDGEDEIVFAATFVTSTVSLGQEAISVTDSLSIDGSLTVGTLTVDGSGLYRILDVAQGASLSIANMTLSNGVAPVGAAVLVREGGSLQATNVTFSGNEAVGNDATQGGGAVYFQASSGEIRDSEFSDNTASGTSGSGGALFVSGSGQTVSIGGTTFSGNTANRAGGAIESRDADLQLSGVDFDSNDAGMNPGNGGAIHLSAAGTATVVAGTVSDNTAVEGGGFWNSSATMTVDGVTFTGNEATGDDGDQGGGALYNNGGRLVVMGSEITGNDASGTSGSGGGILNNMGTLIVMTSDVSDNTAQRAGGGIEDASGTTILVMNTVDGNDITEDAAPGNGGGVHSGGGTVVVAGGTYTNNRAVEGGGLWTSGTLVITSDEADLPADMMPDVVMPTITAATISMNEATGDDPDQGGGGLYATPAGSILIVDATVSDNVASGASGSGGGVFSAGDFTAIDATISGNAANRAGGGIEDAAGTVLLTDVTLSDNSITSPMPGNGGGLHSGGGDVTIVRGAVTDNSAVEGGGLWSNGTLTINGGAGMIGSDDDDDSDGDGDDDSDDGGRDRSADSDAAADGDRSFFTTISGNDASGDDAGTGGGGIYVETGGMASVRYAVIDGNSASGGSGSGGGVLVADGASARLAFTEVTGNAANRAGAGIELFDVPGENTDLDASSIALRQVMVDGNSIDMAAPGNGGGLHAGGAASVTAMMTTFSNNTANEGGGLWINAAGSLELDNSTVSGNEADGDGGGIYDNDGGELMLSSVTVGGNTAGGDGGGLFSASTDMFSFQNTIVGDNEADGSGPDCFGTFVSEGYNLVESNQSCQINDVDTDIIGADPGLQPLADNGGFTMTRAITNSSRAVNAGQSEFDVDQRGLDRQFTQDDIGAFELGASPVSTVADRLEPGAFALSAPSPNPTTGRTSVTFTVRDAAPVEVAVFNVLGQKVLTAFDGPASPADAQTVDVDVSALASGVYVIRLQGAEGVASQQVTVVR